VRGFFSEIIGQLEKIMQEDGPLVQPLWRSLFTYYDKRVPTKLLW
jgi:peptide/nickel transport system substrate-binding protein